MQVPLWLVPSFYGDIRLTATSSKTCTLLAEKLTPQERGALAVLEPKARSKGWISPESSFEQGETAIAAPIGKVSILLAKALKAERTVVSAVRFSDGKIEEVSEGTFDAEAALPKAKVVASAKPAVAASVAAPVRGYPAPDFVNAELKAAEVLSHFLDDGQFDDFQRYNRFISRGVDTGHRYMVTSRHARSELAGYQRTLYDLDEDRPLCVHDWVVPAAEEMLSLHLLLQLPGWESYLRQDTHDLDLLLMEQRALNARA